MFAAEGSDRKIILDEDTNIEKSVKNESGKVAPDLSVYMERGKKMFYSDAGKFIEELRNDFR